MTAYVARTGAQKKKIILAQREDELRHHLKNETTFERIERCSDRVRNAQLGVIKALLYETEPAKAEDDQHEDFRANLLEKRKHWLDVTADEIIEQYQSGL